MIYLNNSASSFPKPVNVISAVNKCISSIPIHQSRTGYDIQPVNEVDETRKILASFFNVPAKEQVIFTSNATESLNLAIKGILSKGDHVITTVADHNSVLRPVNTLFKDKVISLDIVKSDKYGVINPDDIKKTLNEKTKLIIITHASNVTGTVQDIETISTIAHESGAYFLIDISQSAGIIDFDFSASGADMAAFTGHKSLLGIQGIGGLLIKEGTPINPLKTGGTGIRSDYLLQPEELPLYYESGTMNLPGIVSLKEGIKYINQEGMDNLRKHKELLIKKIEDALSEMQKVVIIGRSKEIRQLPVINLKIKNMDVSETGYILENSFQIITRAGLHCAPLIHKSLGTFPKGSVRISPSSFNTEEEIGTFIDAISKIAKTV